MKVRRSGPPLASRLCGAEGQVAISFSDDDVARLTRIQAVIKEYQRKHEDLSRLIEQIRGRSAAVREHAQERLERVRRRLKTLRS